MFKANYIVVYIGGCGTISPIYDMQLCKIKRFNLFDGTPVVSFLSDPSEAIWYVPAECLKTARLMNRRGFGEAKIC